MKALRNTIIVLSKLVESWALVWHTDPTNYLVSVACVGQRCRNNQITCPVQGRFYAQSRNRPPIPFIRRPTPIDTHPAPPRNILPKDCVAGYEVNVAPPLFTALAFWRNPPVGSGFAEGRRDLDKGSNKEIKTIESELSGSQNPAFALKSNGDKNDCVLVR